NYYQPDGPSFNYGGRDYHVSYLGDYLNMPRPHDGESRTVTVILIRLSEGLSENAERRVALVVDHMIGNREIVSKAVGPQVSSVVGIAGATILADGRVVMILDVPALIIEAARKALLAEATSRIETKVVEIRDTIMVVDDSITMRRVAERLLTRQGYRVVTAKDGLDAIALLQTENPVSVLLDIEMPRADGFEVAAFIRNNSRLRSVPIIMITSRSGEKHRERAHSLGVDRYLIKPYQEEQLLAEVNAVRGQAR
ncbi:MAG: response regulator, partial [Nevskia sp.]|nr:response regulator [Nevskia sp.]